MQVNLYSAAFCCKLINLAPSCADPIYKVHVVGALTTLDAVMLTADLALVGVIKEEGGRLSGVRSGEERTCTSSC